MFLTAGEGMRLPTGGVQQKEMARMRKLVLSGFTIMVLTALAWADDVRKDKAHQHWDSNEVTKIPNDSLWAKVAHLDVPGANLPPESGLPGESAAPSDGASRHGMGGGGGGALSGTPHEWGKETGANLPQIPSAVRWLSSRTIREPFVRVVELSGPAKESDAEKGLSTLVDAHETMVAGSPWEAFEAAGETTLRGKVVLTTKKTKEKITPTKVHTQRMPDGKKIQAIVSLRFQSNWQAARLRLVRQRKEWSFSVPCHEQVSR
jgi:hypothetical protein